MQHAVVRDYPKDDEAREVQVSPELCQLIRVGQRIASITTADQIVVLEAGKVVGRGTHSELLGSCPPTSRSWNPSPLASC